MSNTQKDNITNDILPENGGDPVTPAEDVKTLDDLYSSYGMTRRESSDLLKSNIAASQRYRDVDITLDKDRAKYNIGRNIDINYAHAIGRVQDNEWGRSLIKIPRNFVGGFIEGVGYIPELFDSKGDFDNAIVGFGKWIKDSGFITKAYRTDDDTFSFNDAAWWSNNVAGLIESVASFASVGGAYSKALGWAGQSIGKIGNIGKIANVSKFGKVVKDAGVSLALAYTEGAMTGHDVFKEIRQREIDRGLSVASAEKIAGVGSKSAVMVNTVTNTALNYVGISAITGVLGKAAGRTVGGLTRKNAGQIDEALKDIGKRVKKDFTEDTFTKIIKDVGEVAYARNKRDILGDIGGMLGEQLGESVEELVNVAAEQIGLRTGTEENKDLGFFSNLYVSMSGLKNFFDDVNNEEGLLSGTLGFLGGIGQGAVMNNVMMVKNTNPKIDEFGNIVYQKASEEAVKSDEIPTVQIEGEHYLADENGKPIPEIDDSANSFSYTKKGWFGGKAGEQVNLISARRARRLTKEREVNILVGSIKQDLTLMRDSIKVIEEKSKIEPSKLTEKDKKELNEAKANITRLNNYRSVNAGYGSYMENLYNSLSDIDNEKDIAKEMVEYNKVIDEKKKNNEELTEDEEAKYAYNDAKIKEFRTRFEFDPDATPTNSDGTENKKYVAVTEAMDKNLATSKDDNLTLKLFKHNAEKLKTLNKLYEDHDLSRPGEGTSVKDAAMYRELFGAIEMFMDNRFFAKEYEAELDEMFENLDNKPDGNRPMQDIFNKIQQKLLEKGTTGALTREELDFGLTIDDLVNLTPEDVKKAYKKLIAIMGAINIIDSQISNINTKLANTQDEVLKKRLEKQLAELENTKKDLEAKGQQLLLGFGNFGLSDLSTLTFEEAKKLVIEQLASIVDNPFEIQDMLITAGHMEINLRKTNEGKKILDKYNSLQLYRLDDEKIVQEWEELEKFLEERINNLSEDGVYFLHLAKQFFNGINAINFLNRFDPEEENIYIVEDNELESLLELLKDTDEYKDKLKVLNKMLLLEVKKGNFTEAEMTKEIENFQREYFLKQALEEYGFDLKNIMTRSEYNKRFNNGENAEFVVDQDRYNQYQDKRFEIINEVFNEFTNINNLKKIIIEKLQDKYELEYLNNLSEDDLLYLAENNNLKAHVKIINNIKEVDERLKQASEKLSNNPKGKLIHNVLQELQQLNPNYNDRALLDYLKDVDFDELTDEEAAEAFGEIFKKIVNDYRTILENNLSLHIENFKEVESELDESTKKNTEEQIESYRKHIEETIGNLEKEFKELLKPSTKSVEESIIKLEDTIDVLEKELDGKEEAAKEAAQQTINDLKEDLKVLEKELDDIKKSSKKNIKIINDLIEDYKEISRLKNSAGYISDRGDVINLFLLSEVDKRFYQYTKEQALNRIKKGEKAEDVLETTPPVHFKMIRVAKEGEEAVSNEGMDAFAENEINKLFETDLDTGKGILEDTGNLEAGEPTTINETIIKNRLKALGGNSGAKVNINGFTGTLLFNEEALKKDILRTVEVRTDDASMYISISDIYSFKILETDPNDRDFKVELDSYNGTVTITTNSSPRTKYKYILNDQGYVKELVSTTDPNDVITNANLIKYVQGLRAKEVLKSITEYNKDEVNDLIDKAFPEINGNVIWLDSFTAFQQKEDSITIREVEISLNKFFENKYLKHEDRHNLLKYFNYVLDSINSKLADENYKYDKNIFEANMELITDLMYQFNKLYNSNVDFKYVKNGKELILDLFDSLDSVNNKLAETNKLIEERNGTKNISNAAKRKQGTQLSTSANETDDATSKRAPTYTQGFKREEKSKIKYYIRDSIINRELKRLNLKQDYLKKDRLKTKLNKRVREINKEAITKKEKLNEFYKTRVANKEKNFEKYNAQLERETTILLDLEERLSMTTDPDIIADLNNQIKNVNKGIKNINKNIKTLQDQINKLSDKYRNSLNQIKTASRKKIKKAEEENEIKLKEIELVKKDILNKFKDRPIFNTKETKKLAGDLRRYDQLNRDNLKKVNSVLNNVVLRTNKNASASIKLLHAKDNLNKIKKALDELLADENMNIKDNPIILALSEKITKMNTLFNLLSNLNNDILFAKYIDNLNIINPDGSYTSGDDILNSLNTIAESLFNQTLRLKSVNEVKLVDKDIEYSQRTKHEKNTTLLIEKRINKLLEMTGIDLNKIPYFEFENSSTNVLFGGSGEITIDNLIESTNYIIQSVDLIKKEYDKKLNESNKLAKDIDNFKKYYSKSISILNNAKYTYVRRTDDKEAKETIKQAFDVAIKELNSLKDKFNRIDDAAKVQGVLDEYKQETKRIIDKLNYRINEMLQTSESERSRVNQLEKERRTTLEKKGLSYVKESIKPLKDKYNELKDNNETIRELIDKYNDKKSDPTTVYTFDEYAKARIKELEDAEERSRADDNEYDILTKYVEYNKINNEFNNKYKEEVEKRNITASSAKESLKKDGYLTPELEKYFNDFIDKNEQVDVTVSEPGLQEVESVDINLDGTTDNNLFDQDNPPPPPPPKDPKDSTPPNPPIIPPTDLEPTSKVKEITLQEFIKTLSSGNSDITHRVISAINGIPSIKNSKIKIFINSEKGTFYDYNNNEIHIAEDASNEQKVHELIHFLTIEGVFKLYNNVEKDNKKAKEVFKYSMGIIYDYFKDTNENSNELFKILTTKDENGEYEYEYMKDLKYEDVVELFRSLSTGETKLDDTNKKLSLNILSEMLAYNADSAISQNYENTESKRTLIDTIKNIVETIVTFFFDKTKKDSDNKTIKDQVNLLTDVFITIKNNKHSLFKVEQNETQLNTFFKSILNTTENQESIIEAVNNSKDKINKFVKSLGKNKSDFEKNNHILLFANFYKENKTEFDNKIKEITGEGNNANDILKIIFDHVISNQLNILETLKKDNKNEKLVEHLTQISDFVSRFDNTINYQDAITSLSSSVEKSLTDLYNEINVINANNNTPVDIDLRNFVSKLEYIKHKIKNFDDYELPKEFIDIYSLFNESEYSDSRYSEMNAIINNIISLYVNKYKLKPDEKYKDYVDRIAKLTKKYNDANIAMDVKKHIMLTQMKAFEKLNKNNDIIGKLVGLKYNSIKDDKQKVNNVYKVTSYNKETDEYELVNIIDKTEKINVKLSDIDNIKSKFIKDNFELTYSGNNNEKKIIFDSGKNDILFVDIEPDTMGINITSNSTQTLNAIKKDILDIKLNRKEDKVKKRDKLVKKLIELEKDPNVNLEYNVVYSQTSVISRQRKIFKNFINENKDSVLTVNEEDLQNSFFTLSDKQKEYLLNNPNSEVIINGRNLEPDVMLSVVITDKNNPKQNIKITRLLKIENPSSYYAISYNENIQKFELKRTTPGTILKEFEKAEANNDIIEQNKILKRFSDLYSIKSSVTKSNLEEELKIFEAKDYLNGESKDGISNESKRNATIETLKVIGESYRQKEALVEEVKSKQAFRRLSLKSLKSANDIIFTPGNLNKNTDFNNILTLENFNNVSELNAENAGIEPVKDKSYVIFKRGDIINPINVPLESQDTSTTSEDKLHMGIVSSDKRITYETVQLTPITPDQMRTSIRSVFVNGKIKNVTFKQALNNYVSNTKIGKEPPLNVLNNFLYSFYNTTTLNVNGKDAIVAGNIILKKPSTSLKEQAKLLSSENTENSPRVQSRLELVFYNNHLQFVLNVKDGDKEYKYYLNHKELKISAKTLLADISKEKFENASSLEQYLLGEIKKLHEKLSDPNVINKLTIILPEGVSDPFGTNVIKDEIADYGISFKNLQQYSDFTKVFRTSIPKNINAAGLTPEFFIDRVSTKLEVTDKNALFINRKMYLDTKPVNDTKNKPPQKPDPKKPVTDFKDPVKNSIGKDSILKLKDLITKVEDIDFENPTAEQLEFYENNIEVIESYAKLNAKFAIIHSEPDNDIESVNDFIVKLIQKDDNLIKKLKKSEIEIDENDITTINNYISCK